MKLIDLHVHSTASDGSFTPAEVTALAREAGLTAIALTDHDTVSGVGEALAAAGDFPLGSQLMLAAFQKDGFPITMEDLVMENPDTVVTRAHFARALVKKGCVSSVDQAFKKYLDPDRPYYRKREIITPAEAIQAIRNAGGFPVLAHPCLYRLGWMQTEELVRNLKELGLGGMECWHSSNYAEESSKLCRMADRYSLLPTGGSDFHGAAKPDIRIGSGRGNLRVPAEYLDALKLAMFLGQ
ncbi:MAG: PHP domain-containing protein [Enterocloster sp.]